jgi:hypothetical protein
MFACYASAVGRQRVDLPAATADDLVTQIGELAQAG